MKTILTTMFILVVLNSEAQTNGTVDGQIYITTKGRATIRMSLTSVMLVEAPRAKEQLVRALRCLKARIEMDSIGERMTALVDAMPTMTVEQRVVARGTYGRLRDRFLELKPDGDHGKKRLFQLLSELDWQPEATSQTDADGNFHVELPTSTNQWVMVAFSNRKLVGKDEEYVWVVPVRAGQRNLLNNSNLVE